MEQEKEGLVKRKLDAIASIVDILSGFEQQTDIMDVVNFALKHVGGVAAEIQHPGVQPVLGLGAVTPDTIAEFVHAKNPKNEYQRIAVIAYFLMKKKGMSAFTTKDIVDGNTDARQPRFSNVSSSINRTVTRYKYLTSASTKGEYRLSMDAEKMVDALPDHAAAKVITSTTRRTRKGKKSHKDAVVGDE